MQKNRDIRLISLKEMRTLAEEIAHSLPTKGPYFIFLKGNLGTGKTTFTQFLLKALGYIGKVKSPTYSLIEPYYIGDRILYHIDLYRMNGANELYFSGLLDHLKEEAFFVVEWPDLLAAFDIKPNLLLQLDLLQDGAREIRIIYNEFDLSK